MSTAQSGVSIRHLYFMVIYREAMSPDIVVSLMSAVRQNILLLVHTTSDTRGINASLQYPQADEPRKGDHFLRHRYPSFFFRGHIIFGLIKNDTE